MLRLLKEDDLLAVSAETYRLTFAQDRPFIYLDDGQGARLAELFVLSSVHPLHDRDDTLEIGAWHVDENPDAITFSLPVKSSAWEHKVFHLRCEPNRLTYQIEVQGAGQLEQVNYLGGYYSGENRWGSGFFWSGHHFKRGFNPEPNTDEINYFAPSGGSQIDLTGVPLPGKGGWFFTPPPFCFLFQGPNGWLSAGVEAAPGANRFTEYSYHGQLDGFFLSLSYEGHTRVQGQYRLPAIGFDFANSQDALFAAHVNALAKAGAVNTAPRAAASWWREPIFCGWGAQCHLAHTDVGRAPDYSTQANYEHFLAALEENDICPGIIVVDDKWQTSYGENCVDEKKWPDLRGFVEAQHQQQRHTLLWLRAWSDEGLPLDECITNAADRPLASDPTSPAFERRTREAVRALLSPQGYDADGFKIDFTARIPSGPGIRTHGDVWGLELMRLYLGILYDEAKKTKNDALIMTHTPHPYLADVTDMIRLNDINRDQAINPAMQRRARIASIACPGTIIDTDNWPIRDRTAWRNYIRLQPRLGVPSLYYATHIDTTGEALEAEDYKLVRDLWQRYRAGQRKRVAR